MTYHKGERVLDIVCSSTSDYLSNRAWPLLCCWWYVWLHPSWLGSLYFPILLSISWLL